ncbi:MAG: hypothetical protein WAM30_17295 [Candidatus Dormiibacterota bacterium]
MRAPTPAQQIHTLIVNWQQQLQVGTIDYVPEVAPALVGYPACFWLNGSSPDVNTTQQETATYQSYNFSVRFRFTATLKQVEWQYGDNSYPHYGDRGTPWISPQDMFCSNPHTYLRYTDPGKYVTVTATEQWQVNVQTWENTSWGYGDTSWQPGLSQEVDLAPPSVNLTVIQEEGVGAPPPGTTAGH